MPGPSLPQTAPDGPGRRVGARELHLDERTWRRWTPCTRPDLSPTHLVVAALDGPVAGLVGGDGAIGPPLTVLLDGDLAGRYARQPVRREAAQLGRRVVDLAVADAHDPEPGVGQVDVD